MTTLVKWHNNENVIVAPRCLQIFYGLKVVRWGPGGIQHIPRMLSWIEIWGNLKSYSNLSKAKTWNSFCLKPFLNHFTIHAWWYVSKNDLHRCYNPSFFATSHPCDIKESMIHQMVGVFEGDVQQIMIHSVYCNLLQKAAEPSLAIGATLAHLLDQTTAYSRHSQQASLSHSRPWPSHYFKYIET